MPLAQEASGIGQVPTYRGVRSTRLGISSFILGAPPSAAPGPGETVGPEKTGVL